MENESLSAQIVTLKLINTKFKARIAELEAQLEEEKQRTFVQYERAVGFSALNATLEARLKDAEAAKSNAVTAAHALGLARDEHWLRAEKAEADAGRLRALILSAKAKLCPLPTLSCLRLFDEQGKDLRCIYCQVAQDDAAALSPAGQVDDEKGVKG